MGITFHIFRPLYNFFGSKLFGFSTSATHVDASGYVRQVECMVLKDTCFKRVDTNKTAPLNVTENVGWAADMIRDWERDEAAKVELRNTKVSFDFGHSLLVGKNRTQRIVSTLRFL